MNTSLSTLLQTGWKGKAALLAALLIAICYVTRVDADNMSGIVGIFWQDEGAYILSAKNQVLFGTAHFFEPDRWRPELVSPLLHQLALHTITDANPILWLRLSIALMIMGSAMLMARIAAHYYASWQAGLACFICILLNPVLFLYSRTALTEGIQLLLLCIALTLMYRLFSTASLWRTAIYAMLCGMLAGLIFVAKISGVAVCIGLSAGFLTCVLTSRTLPRRFLPLACYAAGALLVPVFYFGIVLQGELFNWWDMNMASQALRRTPRSLDLIAAAFLVKFPDISYYLTFMPIFALYFIGLIIAAQKRGSFLFVLAMVALVTLAIESCLGGEIRRNFFNLALMSILSGFICLEYIRSGVSLRRSDQNSLSVLAVVLVVLHIGGAAYLFYWSILRFDVPYMLFCPLFLLMALIGLGASRPQQKRVRALALMAVALFSIAPMAFQILKVPNTRQEITARIEALTQPDAFFIGDKTPWFLPELHRKVILSNCIIPGLFIDYANDLKRVPKMPHTYYLGDIWEHKRDPKEPNCSPEGLRTDYTWLESFIMFEPSNLAGRRPAATRWSFSEDSHCMSITKKKKKAIHPLQWAGKAAVNTVMHDGIEHAGYLAFLALLSMFPFLVFMVAVIGVIGQGDAGAIFIRSLVDALPHHITAALQPRIVEIISGPPQGLLTISILGAIWTASSAVEGLRTVLNRAYHVATPPAYWFRRSLSIVQFLAFTFIMITGIILVVAIPLFLQHIESFLGFHFLSEHQQQLSVLVFVLAIGVLFVAVCAIYYLIPNIKQHLIGVIPGAAIVVILWIVAAYGFTLYLSNFQQVNLIYGSLGGIIAALLFSYICNVIFIFGAELNYQILHGLGLRVVEKEHVEEADIPKD